MPKASRKRPRPVPEREKSQSRPEAAAKPEISTGPSRKSAAGRMRTLAFDERSIPRTDADAGRKPGFNSECGPPAGCQPHKLEKPGSIPGLATKVAPQTDAGII